MAVVDKLFESLTDGNWHDINEISAKKPFLNLSTSKLLKALEFLAEYGFIELSEAWKGDPLRSVTQARLPPLVQEFIQKITGLNAQSL